MGWFLQNDLLSVCLGTRKRKKSRLQKNFNDSKDSNIERPRIVLRKNLESIMKSRTMSSVVQWPRRIIPPKNLERITKSRTMKRKLQMMSVSQCKVRPKFQDRPITLQHRYVYFVLLVSHLFQPNLTFLGLSVIATLPLRALAR